MSTRFMTIALLGLGSIIQVGFALPALAGEGDPDPVYGGGILRPAVATEFNFPAVTSAWQDGRIILCSVDSANRHLFLSRFDASGRPDTSFGAGGVVDTGVVIDLLRFQLSLATKADSLIVIAAHTNYSHKLFVIQFGPSGARDPGFGLNGLALVQVYTEVDTGFDIAVTDRDEIVLGGIDTVRREAFLTRFTPAGAVDTAFGAGGFAYAGVRASNDAQVSVDTSAEGAFLASVDETTGRTYAACFDRRGDLVPTFGIGGVSLVDVHGGPGAPVGLQARSSAQIYVAGRDDSTDEAFVTRLDSRGAPEPAFGDDGIARTGIGLFLDGSLALAIQVGGTAVLAGKDPNVPYFYLCRFDTLGHPDPEFGEGGVARLGIDNLEEAQVALAVCPEDKLLMASQDIGVQRAFTARFTAEGRLDRAGLLPGRVFSDLDHPFDARVAMAPLPDGGRYLAGIAGESFYYVQRVDSTGLRDPGFWLGGSRILDDIIANPSGPVDIAVIPGTEDFYLLGLDEAQGRLYVRRFHGDGSEDTLFGSGLPVGIGIDVDWYSDAALVARPNGKVRIAGLMKPLHQHFLVGLLANGQIDDDFGSAGVVITDVHGDSTSRLGLAAETGALILAGLDQENRQAFLMRFLAGGILDTGFGEGGIAHSGEGCLGGGMFDAGIALSPAGPAVAGYCGGDPLGGENFVARFTGEGFPDPGFGADGRSCTGIATLDYLPVAIAFQSDLKVVLAGARAADLRNVLVRFDRDGTLDPNFGTVGVAVLDFRAGYGTGICLESLDDGKLLCAGRDVDRGQDYLARILAASEGGSASPEGPPAREGPVIRVYPNPFNPVTVVRFHMQESGPVKLGIYDPRGRRVRVLVDERLDPGWHDRTWRGDDDCGRPVGSGIYLVRYESGGEFWSRKVALVR